MLASRTQVKHKMRRWKLERHALLVAGLVLFAACSTSNAVCPRDTTADLDVTITQLTQQPVTAVPESAPGRIGAATPPRGAYPIKVQYAVVVANRSAAAVRLKQISLEEPHLIGYRPQVQCFGVELLGPPFEPATRGFDELIAPGSEARVVMLVTELPSTTVLDPPALAMTARVRIETDKGVRSETLTRKVVPFGAARAASRGGSAR